MKKISKLCTQNMVLAVLTIKILQLGNNSTSDEKTTSNAMNETVRGTQCSRLKLPADHLISVNLGLPDSA